LTTGAGLSELRGHEHAITKGTNEREEPHYQLKAADKRSRA